MSRQGQMLVLHQELETSTMAHNRPGGGKAGHSKENEMATGDESVHVIGLRMEMGLLDQQVDTKVQGQDTRKAACPRRWKSRMVGSEA